MSGLCDARILGKIYKGEKEGVKGKMGNGKWERDENCLPGSVGMNVPVCVVPLTS